MKRGTNTRMDILELVQPHLLEMPAYEPVEPVDVDGGAAGDSGDRDRQAGREREPLRALAARGGGAGGVSVLPHLSGSSAARVREAVAEYVGVDAGAGGARRRARTSC